MPNSLAEARSQRQVEGRLRRIGPSESVERFLNAYGKVRSRATYGAHLSHYFEWLRKKKGVVIGPDDLIRDNLVCIYRSEPEDVALKRKHRALLEEYVNVEMAGASSSYRRVAAAAVKGFYDRNDSPLYGRLRIAEGSPEAPSRALKAEDIRKALLALPIQVRAPLLVEWQSGVEISRVLSLRWETVIEGLERGDCPLKLEFFGRKRHRRAYHTYVGRDSIRHLGLLKEAWVEKMGRVPTGDDLVFIGKRGSGMDYSWLNEQLKRAAKKLSRLGEIENGDLRSWHTHMLRHSFKSEAMHAGVQSGLVEFLMGHDEGISAVYDNRDQVHEEDFVKAYSTLEPFVSLDYNEATAQMEKEKTGKEMLKIIAELQRKVSVLEAQQVASAAQGRA